LVLVVGKGARLAYQALDDMAVVDGMLALARKPRHALDGFIAVVDVDRIGIDDHVDLPADQTTRHRIDVFQYTNSAGGRDANAPDIPATIKLLRREVPHGRFFFTEFFFARCVATVFDLLEERHVLFHGVEVAASSKKKSIFHGPFEMTMQRFYIAVFVGFANIGAFGGNAVVVHQIPVAPLEKLLMGEVVDGSSQAIGSVPRRDATHFPESFLESSAQRFK